MTSAGFKATTTNTRQAVAPKHPKQWGIGRVSLHQHLLQGEDCLLSTMAGDPGERPSFQTQHTPVPALQRLFVSPLPSPSQQLPLLKAIGPRQEQMYEPAKGTQPERWLIPSPPFARLGSAPGTARAGFWGGHQQPTQPAPKPPGSRPCSTRGTLR